MPQKVGDLYLVDITLSSSGSIDPIADITVDRGKDIVVWIGPMDSEVGIDFQKNPFGKRLVCEGRVCAALVPPPHGPKGEPPFKYTVTVELNGKKAKLDPNVIVVP
ncbi:MAG TPA: hypothetical protein VGA31_02525 [Thermoanaerobaculia bacterium]